MNYGIALLSVVPLRYEPNHRSEMVSQLLFGDLYEVLLLQNNWLHIRCAHDGYEGYIDQNQHREIAEKDFAAISAAENGLALDLIGSVSSSHHSIPVALGSTLPFFDGMNLRVGKDKFIYHGQSVQHENKNPALLERVAMRYLNSPYLWGGRSPLGIDCSGFTQVIYKFANVVLKRDAYQQAEQGTIVNFVEEAQPVDLAFFANAEGKIIHVGMVLKDQRIIHASGKVRIDKLDHFGIYNADTKKYSHQLKIIKRVV